MKNTVILFARFISIIFVLGSCTHGVSPPTNSTNNETVTISKQIWMKKNLDVNHYRNGDPIPEVKDSAEWAKLTTGAWCYYNNNPALGAIYGKLYNRYAASDPRGLAPNGWHLPTFDEWLELRHYWTNLNNSNYYDDLIGGRLKEAGTAHWQTPNAGATNTSGFTALPGGCRDTNSVFKDVNIMAYIKLLQYQYPVDPFDARAVWISCYWTDINFYKIRARCGVSVRCIKDTN